MQRYTFLLTYTNKKACVFRFPFSKQRSTENTRFPFSCFPGIRQSPTLPRKTFTLTATPSVSQSFKQLNSDTLHNTCDKSITHKESSAHIRRPIGMIIGKHIQAFQLNRHKTAITSRVGQYHMFKPGGCRPSLACE